MFLRSSTPTIISGTAIPAASSNNFPRTPKFDLLRKPDKSIPTQVSRCRLALQQKHKDAKFKSLRLVFASLRFAENDRTNVGRFVCSIGPASHFLDGYRDDRLVSRGSVVRDPVSCLRITV